MKKLLWTVIPILLLSLLIGCDKQPQTPPTTEPAVTQPAPTVTTAPTTEPGPDPAEVSLNSLRQSLVGTPQKFAAAYLGTLEQETQSKRSSDSRQTLLPWLLDIIASVTVLMMTLAFTLEILSV